MKKKLKIKRYTKPSIKKESVKVNKFSKNNNFLVDDAVLLACYYYTCIQGDMHITMVDNQPKKVKSLKVGDRVMSYDLISGTLSTSEVILVVQMYREGYYVINNFLKLTNDHPLWVNDKNWKKVDELVFGDTLFTQENKPITVNNLTYVKEKSVVYNIQLAGENKTYFVEEILTHTYSHYKGEYILGDETHKKEKHLSERYFTSL